MSNFEENLHNDYYFIQKPHKPLIPYILNQAAINLTEKDIAKLQSEKLKYEHDLAQYQIDKANYYQDCKIKQEQFIKDLFEYHNMDDCEFTRTLYQIITDTEDYGDDLQGISDRLEEFCLLWKIYNEKGIK